MSTDKSPLIRLKLTVAQVLLSLCSGHAEAVGFGGLMWQACGFLGGFRSLAAAKGFAEGQAAPWP